MQRSVQCSEEFKSSKSKIRKFIEILCTCEREESRNRKAARSLPCRRKPIVHKDDDVTHVVENNPNEKIYPTSVETKNNNVVGLERDK